MTKIPKSFFYDNPLDDYSAFSIVYLYITNSDEFDVALNEPDEESAAMREENMKLIDSADTTEKLIDIIRKMKSVVCSDIIIEKAIAAEDEAAPLIIEKYIRSGNDIFIEISIHILAKMNGRYTRELFERYSEIRNPYAQSMACVLFAMKMGRKINGFLMGEFEKFAGIYDEDIDYSEGPLLALYIANDMY